MIAPNFHTSTPRRTGYTLLEMSLALAIALIILGAVYEFLNRQITLAEIGRDLVEETKTARQILDRMAGDIVAAIGGTDPKQLPETTTDTATGEVVPPPTGATGSTASAATDTTQTTPYLSPFNTFVEGTSTLLILSASRVPRELLAPDKRYLTSSEAVSDLRRISYWYVDDGSNGGLARQELVGVTTGDFASKPPDVGEIDKFIISGHTASYRDPCEVVGVQFEYFDGAGFHTEWNGSDLAADGVTPIGPPSAIRVTLTIKNRNGQTRDYRRTVAIPTGNNFVTQQNGF